MLLDELKNLANAARLEGCVTGKWLQTQEPEVAELLKEISSSPNGRLIDAFKLLQKHDPNLPFKRTSFTTHMRGTCACPVT